MKKAIPRKNKALTLSPYADGRNVGGPPGFIETNYRNRHLPNCDFAFLQDFPISRKGLSKAVLSRVNSRFVEPLKSRILKRPPLTEFPWIQDSGNNARRLYIAAEAKDYKAVVFHDLISLFFCLPLIPKSQIAVIYPHSPELLHEEMITFGEVPCSEIVNWAERVVTPECFERSNAVILPNKGVMEIYGTVISPKSKVYFVSSGSSLIEVKETLHLDPRFTTFLYIGRRQEIKGFDIILDAFLQAYSQDQNLRLVIAGKGPLVLHPGIIDLQATSRPHLWMKSVSCVVNANRQSYFDRSVIEALSVGAPLLMSCTHGHAELRNASPGIHAIQELTKDSLTAAFLQIGFSGFPQDAKEANRRLYTSRYSDECHRAGLATALDAILEQDI